MSLKLGLVWHGLIGFCLLSSCGAGEDPTMSVHSLERDPGVRGEPGELVYQVSSVVESDGTVVELNETGTLSAEVWAQAARPDHHTISSEGMIYNEGGFERLDELGRTVRMWEVRKLPTELPPLGPPKQSIASDVQDWVDAADAGEAYVVLQFSQLQVWDVPLRPPIDAVGVIAAAQMQAERDAAIERRKQTAAALTTWLSETHSLDVVSEPSWSVGSVTVRVTSDALRTLLATSEISGAEFLSEAFTNGCSTAPSCTLSPQTIWRIGEGRIASRTNVGTYIGMGWDGERANPGRHSFGDITAAVLD